jgi:transcriptional regulator GlxA family with amidase domain
MVCLEGRVRFRTPCDEHWIGARSVLIPAGSRISIDNREAVLAACYLDAGAADLQWLRRQMRSTHRGIFHQHRHEDQLIEDLRQLRDAQPCFDDAQERIEHLVRRYSEGIDATVDPRITHVIERLRDTASLNISVKSLASEVGLSESGLIKLFNLHVGVPIRRHRLWYRLIDFVTLSLSGVPSATAIKTAGFTDAAHLSRCYSGFFGVNHSYAFSRNTLARYVVDPRRQMVGKV